MQTLRSCPHALHYLNYFKNKKALKFDVQKKNPYYSKVFKKKKYFDNSM